MASIFLFGLTTFLVILVTLIIIYYKITKTSKKLPPGKTGWPIIGETLDYVTSPEKFIRERMSKYSSEVFKTSIAGGKMAILCGASGNKFMFSKETNKLVTSWWPRSISQHLIFPHDYSRPSAMVRDHSFLKLETMQQYVSVMDYMAKDHLVTKWAPHSEVKVHPLSKEFTFALACRAFINYENPHQVQELAKPFFDVAKGIMSTPLNIPGTPFNGAVKGGALIKEKLLQIIRKRREELRKNNEESKEGRDLLSRLLITYDENNDGKLLNEKEVANKIISYLMASFYTTSTTITFVLNNLAEHPLVYDKVLEEQMEIIKSKQVGEPLTWADIQRMKYTWNVVCESMRLTPPSQGAFKEVLTDISYAGFNIPKGWKVCWSVHSTFKNDEYFKNPEKFDPSRFDGNGPPPFTFMPFGGGPRMCVGKEYARIEILVFLHNVVTKFRLSKANPNEKIIYTPEPIPIEGLRICIKPHEK